MTIDIIAKVVEIDGEAFVQFFTEDGTVLGIEKVLKR